MPTILYKCECLSRMYLVNQISWMFDKYLTSTANEITIHITFLWSKHRKYRIFQYMLLINDNHTIASDNQISVYTRYCAIFCKITSNKYPISSLPLQIRNLSLYYSVALYLIHWTEWHTFELANCNIIGSDVDLPVKEAAWTKFYLFIPCATTVKYNNSKATQIIFLV